MLSCYCAASWSRAKNLREKKEPWLPLTQPQPAFPGYFSLRFLTQAENIKCSISLCPSAVNYKVLSVFFIFSPICSAVLHISGSPAGTCKALTSPHILLLSVGRASLNTAGAACAAALLTAGHTGTRENVCVWGLNVQNIIQACIHTQAALSYMQWINMAACQVAASITPHFIFDHFLSLPDLF